MREVISESISYRFPKMERLHHRSLTEGVFRLGKSFYEFPFRVNWRTLSPEELEKNFRNSVPEGISKVQMMVTVPKKKRKKAVDRVLMRRRIREAYRLNKILLTSEADKRNDIATLSLALVYVHDKNLPFTAIEEKIKVTLHKLAKKITAQEASLSHQEEN